MSRRLSLSLASLGPGVAWGWAMLWWAMLWWAPPAAAEDGLEMVHTFGRGGRAVTLVVDPRWVSAHGYRPVRVEATLPGGRPATTDRTLRVELQLDSWEFGSAVVSETIEIPAGSLRGAAEVLVPVYSHTSSCAVRLFEHGAELESVLPGFVGVQLTNHYRQNSWGTLLAIDRDAPSLADRRGGLAPNVNRTPGATTLPDAHVLAMALASQSNMSYSLNYPVSDRQLLDTWASIPNATLAPGDALPSSAGGWSSIDLIVIALDDAQQVAAQQPAAWRRLLDRVAAGAALVVHGAGDDFQRLAEVDPLVGLAPAALGPDGWSSNSPGQGSQLASRRTALSLVANAERIALEQMLSGVNRSAHPELADRWQARHDFWAHRQQHDYQLLVVRPYLLGKVIVLGEDDPFPGSQTKWENVVHELSPFASWETRLGVDQGGHDHQFWSHLIPNVGLPPVNAFRVLITVFCIAIGPVNYWMLRRRRRLHLLLVTVPLGAGVVTASLFAYAVLKDGVSVRARARSFTVLDQAQGRVAGWSRQTYYASVAPSQPLRFPADCLAYPLTTSDRWATARATRRLHWTAAGGELSGYVGSRRMSQFLVQRAGDVPVDMELTWSPGRDGAAPRMVNRLGTPLEHLFVVDPEGQSWYAANLAPGAEVELAPRAWDLSTSQELRQLWARYQPHDPLGGSRGWWSQRRRIYYGSSREREFVTNGVLEHELRTALLAANSSLPPRSYLAIANRSPLVPLGLPRVREEPGLHVVRGSW